MIGELAITQQAGQWYWNPYLLYYKQQLERLYMPDANVRHQTSVLALKKIQTTNPSWDSLALKYQVFVHMYAQSLNYPPKQY